MRLVNRDWPAIVAVAWVAFIVLVIAGLALGWVLNIIALAGTTVPPITGLFVLRIVGIFIPPIGGIVGYL